MSAGISIREFARRDGCNEKLVRRAIAQGRLQRDAAGLVDAALVGTAWRAGNLKTAAPPAPAAATTQARMRTLSAGGSAEEPAPASATPQDATPPLGPTYAQAQARKEHFLAEKHELEYRARRGELVDFAMARSVLFNESRRGRDHWLNWPARAAATIAAELGAEPDRVAEILTAHVVRHLEALAQSDGDELRAA